MLDTDSDRSADTDCCKEFHDRVARRVRPHSTCPYACPECASHVWWYRATVDGVKCEHEFHDKDAAPVEDGTCADDHDTQGRTEAQVNASEAGVAFALVGFALVALGVAVSLAWPAIERWFR